MGTTNPHPYTPYKAKCIQYIIVRTAYKANNIRGLTTSAGMAEPHSPPPEEQAIPGSIPYGAPFFSIVDSHCFAVRLSKVGQVGQAEGTLRYGGHYHFTNTSCNQHHIIHTTHTRPYAYSISIVRTEYKANSIGLLGWGTVGLRHPSTGAVPHPRSRPPRDRSLTKHPPSP